MEEIKRRDEEEMSSEELPPELRALGESVGRLPRPEPPTGLARRTINRMALELPTLRTRWWLRPITHPLARAFVV